MNKNLIAATLFLAAAILWVMLYFFFDRSGMRLVVAGLSFLAALANVVLYIKDRKKQ